MSWAMEKLLPGERHLFRGNLVRVGEFDCVGGHPSFPVTEPVQNNLFVLATKPVWFRRNTRGFHYVGPGGILLHPSGSTIERRCETSSHDLSYWFAIKPDVYSEITAAHNIEHRLPTSPLCPSPAMQLELGLLLRRIREGSATTLDVEANVIALLDSICGASGVAGQSSGAARGRAGTRARARRQADVAKSFVDANLASGLDVSAVASEVGVSAFHLCRLFKAVNGITLHEYRIRQRLAFVVHRLVDRARLNLLDLALDAGFSSHSHLTRTFKNRLGIAPSIARDLA